MAIPFQMAQTAGRAGERGSILTRIRAACLMITQTGNELTGFRGQRPFSKENELFKMTVIGWQSLPDRG
jgi:hypothetical protein